MAVGKAARPHLSCTNATGIRPPQGMRLALVPPRLSVLVPTPAAPAPDGPSPAAAAAGSGVAAMTICAPLLPHVRIVATAGPRSVPAAPAAALVSGFDSVSNPTTPGLGRPHAVSALIGSGTAGSCTSWQAPWPAGRPVAGGRPHAQAGPTITSGVL